MENHINVVAGTFYLVAKSSSSRGNFGMDYNTWTTYGLITASEDNKLYYGNMVIDMSTDAIQDKPKVDYYKKLFSQLSLPQLRDILYLLVPCANNFISCSNDENHLYHVNTLSHVKTIIKYIEKEIFITNNDDVKNNIDLFNTNKLLKNKCDYLESELSAIKNMINKI